MNNKKLNAILLWKQIEDVVAPRLRLGITDRVVYSHLVRHSRLEGKTQFRFSIPWLAKSVGLCDATARQTVRRLIAKGAVRLIERSSVGHIIEVPLPGRIRAVQSEGRASKRARKAADLEKLDFLHRRGLRESIHARERGMCFYCLRRVKEETRCLDHVVPRAASGQHSYRNLVSSCLECNTQKRVRSAADFLRWLYRERRLTADELAGRLRALDALMAGRLRPAVGKCAAKDGESRQTPGPRKGRWGREIR
jgi:5-methylcytosine-specific restriction endonuclease McrA